MSRASGFSLIAWNRMRKPEIAKRLARQSGVSNAEAADQLDHVVNQILAKLRKGQPAALPGLGQFTPGPGGSYQFKPGGTLGIKPHVPKPRKKEKPAGHGLE